MNFNRDRCCQLVDEIVCNFSTFSIVWLRLLLQNFCNCSCNFSTYSIVWLRLLLQNFCNCSCSQLHTYKNCNCGKRVCITRFIFSLQIMIILLINVIKKIKIGKTIAIASCNELLLLQLFLQ